MGPRYKLVFMLLLVVAIVILFFWRSDGQTILPVQAKVIEVINAQLDLGPPPPCVLLDKIDEPALELESMSLKIGKKKFSYYDTRIGRSSSGKITTTNKKITDVEREIGLKLLNLNTCDTQVIKITKQGNKIIAPPGYDIRVVRRSSGLTWNAWNTHFYVASPSQSVVIKNAWPTDDTRVVTKTVTDKRGHKKTTSHTEKYVRNVIYTPYSADDPSTPDIVEPGIHTPEVFAGGVSDLKEIINKARSILRDNGVMSKAFPGQIVSDLPFLPPQVYERLMIIEQSDEGEFALDPRTTFERVLVILRVNRGKAWSETCNRAGACGPFQFTNSRGNGTYAMVVKSFPTAGLIKNFKVGAADHINSAMAAILLHDLNLKDLVRLFGPGITNDPIVLEELEDGGYNANPKWVHKSLTASLAKGLADWSDTKYLRTETRGYLVKLRYLAKNNLP